MEMRDARYVRSRSRSSVPRREGEHDHCEDAQGHVEHVLETTQERQPGELARHS
jgi:hypothetical protein